MRKKNGLSVCLLAFWLVSCAPAPATDTSKIEAAASEDAAKTKKSVDMKALFGDDYQPGDIGHAFGEVVSTSQQTASITIDHGPIHGTPNPAATSKFDVIASEEITALSGGDQVEFLVRKGDDGTYRVSEICKMEKGSGSCL